MTAVPVERRWRRLPLWAVHPLLLGAYPVLFLFAANIQEQLSAAALLPPLAVVLAATAAALLVHWLIVRDATRAGLLTSLLVALFFSYGHVADAVGEPVGHAGLLALAWAVLAIAGMAAIAAVSRRHARTAGIALTVVAAALVTMNVVPIVEYQLRLGNDVRSDRDVTAETTDVTRRPDIYYIVPDRYAAQSTLEELYGYDNRAFLDALEERGFYIADESRANYLKTTVSLASSLEMDYLDMEALAAEATAPDDWQPIYRMLREPLRAPATLKSLGYTYFHVGTWYSRTSTNELADTVLRYSALSDFSAVLHDSTVLPIIRGAGSGEEASEYRDTYRGHALYQFDVLPRIRDQPGPKFVFAHISLPHPPYVFDARGNWITQAESRRGPAHESYGDQLTYTNSRLLEFIDHLLAVPEGSEPVILLQADEGPYPADFDRDQAAFDWRDATPDQLAEKYNILNAYYLPGGETEELYPAITPVNTFRVVFNAYFGSNLPLLPDRSYAFNAADIYRQIDVTDRIPRRVDSDRTATGSVSFDSRPPHFWPVGTERTYRVTVTNETEEAWRADGPERVQLAVDVGTSGAEGEEWLIQRRFGLPHDVAPGESAEVEVTLTSPPAEATYLLRHRVFSGAAGFFEQVDQRPITVVPVDTPTETPETDEAPNVAQSTAALVIRLVGAAAAWLTAVALFELARHWLRRPRRAAT